MDSPWKPIDDAAKDGNPIFIAGGDFSDDWGETWNPMGSEVTIAYWRDSGPGFLDWDGHGLLFRPLWWMAIPEIPEEEGANHG